jgi:phthalate 4,5-dioxygenase oxygenase subunit
MMTHEENRALTGVSPGTPLHEPLSRYWYPVARSAELGDRCTRKFRLLGEDFVIARRGDELIAHEERCPHRQSSLTLARVEDGGLRCIYHGWLIGRDGTVKEAPNEREAGGRRHVRVRSPLAREAGGLVWVNVCENEAERAPFPAFPWIDLPADRVVIADVVAGANWVQSLEGAIDSSHSSHLHSDEIVGAVTTGASSAASSSAVGSGAATRFARPSVDKHPRIHLRDTGFGFIYGAIRTPLVDPETMVYIRASGFAFPSYATFPSSNAFGDLQIFVPVDEGHTHFFYIRYSTRAPLDEAGLLGWSGLVPGTDKDEENRLRVAALPNWGQDRAAMAAGRSFTGLKGVNLQDIVVQESMGSIVDRTREHLGAADRAIMHFRRLLLTAARGEGAAASGFARAVDYKGLLARDGLLPMAQDWTELYKPGEVDWKSTGDAAGDGLLATR